MGSYLLSIDNGLTTTKAVIFTLDGQEIAAGVVDTQVENHGDWAEIDMERQWVNTVRAIREALSKSGINSSEISGIGNSGHGGGIYPLDIHGKPVRLAISSMDGRAAATLNDWQQSGVTNYPETYQNMWLGQAIPLLHWLKDHEPQNYDRIANVLMAKDWIRYRLTGELYLEYTDASNSGLINLNTREFDSEIFTPFGMPELLEKLPQLRNSMSIAGYLTAQAAELTGLAIGTPVIGGLFDVVACALGSGIYDSKQYSITAGTWNINSGVESAITPSSDIMEWILYADNLTYMCIDSSATSAVNLEWCIKNMIDGLAPETHDPRIYQKIETEISKLPTETNGIIYLPFIYKSKLTQHVEGSFFGIKASHNIYHLLRAIYEGVAFAHLKHIDNLRKGGIVKQRASLSGGASQSSFWCQLFADVLNIEIVTTKTSQVGALGVAIAVATATGVYRNLEEAVKTMVREDKHFFPGEQSLIYQEKYQKFNRIIDIYDNQFLK